jgi:DNA primase
MTPPDGLGLLKHLRSRGYKDQDLVECSLATASADTGRIYDFLRRRITIPIRDTQGRIIAFGGRALDDDPAKYKNSGNTRLFDKSHTLFGFDSARKAMRERGRAILVEGYMDVLQLWQQGFPEAVACLGTAFTEHHIRLLRNATGVVILLFDGDKAGQRATLKSVDVALTTPEVHVKAVALPNGQDPDDFVRASGAPALEALIAQSVYLVDFAVREKLRVTENIAVPELISKELVPWLAKVPDLMQRDFLTVRIAHLTGIPVDRIKSQLPTAAGAMNLRQVAAARAGAAAASPATPLEPAVYELYGHVFYASPGEVDFAEVRACLQRELRVGTMQQVLLEEMLATLEQGTAPSLHDAGTWESALAPENLALLDRLRAAGPAFTCGDRAVRITRALAHVRHTRAKEILGSLKTQVARLAALPDQEDELRQVLKTIGELNRELSIRPTS